MRRIGRIAIGMGTLVVLMAPIGAQAGEPPPDEEPEPATTSADLGEELDAELQELIDELGLDTDPASLVGEAGDLDLPPGELVYEGLVTAAEEEGVPDGGGSSLAGPCTGAAISFDGDGGIVDAAADFDPAAPPVDLIDGGQAFTASNPFEVDVNGYVVYAGQAAPAPLNHEWFVRVQGLNLDEGGDDNPDAEDRNAGSVNLSDDLPGPAKVNALFAIDGEMTADDGFACSGSGFIKTVGGAPVLGGLGLVLALAGGLGALFNARPARTWRS
jgi:hypothetical protein